MTRQTLAPQPALFRHLFQALCLFVLLLATSARAADQPRELLIGIEPEHNIFNQMERYGQLAAYLSEKSGFPVRLTIMSRYGEVLQRFKALHLDGAFLNAYTATLAIDELGMEPIARPVELNGETFAHGLIFTRRDSGIHQIPEMRGKSFAFVDPATSTGYLFPLAFLKQHGISNIKTFFSHYFFTGGHASAISAVLDGRADLGAARDRIYNSQIAKDPSIGKELVVLEKSPPIPENTLCLKQDLPADLKKRLTEIMLGMDQDREGREVLKTIDALRFIRAARTDYDIVRQMEKEAGLPRPSH